MNLIAPLIYIESADSAEMASALAAHRTLASAMPAPPSGKKRVAIPVHIVFSNVSTDTIGDAPKQPAAALIEEDLGTATSFLSQALNSFEHPAVKAQIQAQ
jgi:hypothetical protein